MALLLPDGGKLKFSKLLLRQPDEAGAGTTSEFFALEQIGGTPGVRLEVEQLLGWWKGGQEQRCLASAGDADITAAGGDQDAPAPCTGVAAAAIKHDPVVVQPTAAYAPAQIAAALTRAALSIEPTGAGNDPPAGHLGTPNTHSFSQNTHVTHVQEHETGNHGAGATGTVFPMHGAPATGQEEQLAAAAAWPGEEPQAQLRRAAAAVLLRTARGPQGPHSLQQVGGTPRARHLLYLDMPWPSVVHALDSGLQPALQCDDTLVCACSWLNTSAPYTLGTHACRGLVAN